MLVRSLLIAVFLISSSLAQSALAELPQFIPVDVPNHVYDGGWEHFVGGGVAVFDCNGDSKPDLVAAGGTNLPILLRNTSRVAGEVSFVAATPKNLDLKGTTGVYPIDANNDGLLDLMVLRVGSDKLLHGAGDCTFSPAPLEIGDHWSTAFSATWEANQIKPTFAFGHYVDQANAEGPFEACDTNIIMRPTASGYSLIKLNPGYCALSMLFTDWARKGSADLRISNDRHYYVHKGEEQLWKMANPPKLYSETEGWKRHMLWGMGIATRDLDRDGRDEVFLSSMGDQRLMEQVGEGPTYKDVPFARGTAAQRPYIGDDGRPSTGWHIAFGDIQNDGYDDIFIAKGNVQQMPGNAIKDPNNLLIGQVDGSFVERGDVAGVASFHRGRGAALVDLNNDGLLDLAVVNRRAPLQIWQNTTPTSKNWLGISLHQEGANTQAVGAWIEVDNTKSIQSREITVGGGHAGGTAVPQHFGLGDQKIVRLRIKWPHSKWSKWQHITSNQILKITR